MNAHTEVHSGGSIASAVRLCFILAFAALVRTAVAGTVAPASENWGGYGNPLWANLTDETTQSGFLAIGDGEVHKTGAGFWQVPLSTLMPSYSHLMYVYEGSVAFTAGGAASSVAEPAFLRSRAALWLSAKTGERQTADAAAGGLEFWYDVRETTPAAPAYMYAQSTNTYASRVAQRPSLAVFQGKDVVNFGGLGSGQTFSFMNPSGKMHTAQDVRSYYVVHATHKVMGALAGVWTYRANSVYDFPFPNSVYDSSQTNTTTTPYYVAYRGTQADTRFHRNGSAVSNGATPETDAFELWDLEQQANAVRIDGIFRLGSDDNAYRYKAGGDEIAEVVVFTNAVSAAERLQLEAYLMQKWGIGENTSTAPHLQLADGTQASLEVPAASTATVSGIMGAGTLAKTGEGTLRDWKDSNYRESTVSLSLQAGSMETRHLVPFRAESGQALAAVPRGSGSEVDAVTPAAAADGAFEKSGLAELTVNAVDSDVTNVSVTAGRLVLAPQNAAAVEGIRFAAPIEIALQNPSFEFYPDWLTDAQVKYYEFCSAQSYAKNDYLPGWKSEVYKNTPAGNNWWKVMRMKGTQTTCDALKGVQPADGQAFLGLMGVAQVSQVVNLPAAGRCELTLSLHGNVEWTGVRMPLRAWLLDESSEAGVVSTNSFGVVYPLYEAASARWTRHTLSVDVSKAGQYRLVIGSKTNSGYTSGLDDVRLILRPQEVGRRRVSVPNGTFDTVKSWGTINKINEKETTVDGWTWNQNGRPLTNPGIAVVNVLMPAYWLSDRSVPSRGNTGERPFFPGHRLPLGGQAALALLGDGASATTTFTPPAGTWRLKAFAWPNPCATGSTDSRVAATMTPAGGTAVALGSVGTADTLGADVLWPEAFTADGETPITLTLAFVRSNEGIVTIDDLELVEAERSVGELVTDGGFEERGPEQTSAASFKHWQLCTMSGTPITTYGAEGGQHYYSWDNLSAYPVGRDIWAGDGYAVLPAQNMLRQTLTFPSAGVYELVFAVHQRSDEYWDAKRQIPLQAAIYGAGAETNLLVTVTPYTRSFIRHAYRFVVPTAGERTLAFSMPNVPAGMTETWMCHNLLDGVSVKAVSGDQDVQMLSEQATVTVAKGAKLYLGFTGTNNVLSVRHGKGRRSGVISAATHPEFVEGPGALFAEPAGLLLLFR